jgi:hypothetical protein
MEERKMGNNFYVVGKKYFIMTGTNFFTGEAVSVDDRIIVLNKCAWIADTGRLHDALRDGKFNEVEPMGDGIAIHISSIVSSLEWKHQLPVVQQ